MDGMTRGDDIRAGVDFVATPSCGRYPKCRRPADVSHFWPAASSPSSTDCGGSGNVRMGLFGASTAAAALVMAAANPKDVRAVVSRGGRPDLAGDALIAVQSPTLFIVGSEDREVLEPNRRAMARMKGDVRLEVVHGASHLFHEPGALETVADLPPDGSRPTWWRDDRPSI
jgi:dienelactone hydrolase